MKRWLVLRKDRKTDRWHIIDEVYFTVDCDADYVRNSLINHDGYSSSIQVRRA